VTILPFCASLLLWVAPPLPAQETLLEVVRHQVESEALSRPVSVVVQLPRGYSEGDSRYPLYYYLGAESRTRVALIASTMRMMAANGEFPPVILVGIELPDGNGVLIPPCSERFQNSQAEAHLCFLADELTPFIDGRYRTHPFRILAGASNSGLFAIHAMLSRPGSFSAYFAWSPAIGWCSESVVSRVEALSDEPATPPFLYVNYGDEDFGNLVKDALPAFLQAVRSAGPERIDMTVERVPGAGHVPMQGFYAAPKALLPQLHAPRDRVAPSLQELLARYAGVSKRLGFEYGVPAEQLFDLGADYVVNDKDYQAAEEAFKHLIEAYPDRADGYAGMAFAKLRNDELDLASEWVDKALAVDSEHGFAKRVQQRIAAAKTGT